MEKTSIPPPSKPRIAARWEAAGAFRAGRPERARRRAFCVVIPPPNVTGNLHMGHALNNTLQDILCRYQRMKGRDVLWQPGTDHAGIATQMVVERQLMERQEPDRRALGREKFLERVWAWKAESGGAIVNQLKRLGASCDWSRERFTLDEGLSKAVAKVFVAASSRRADLQGQAAGQLGPEVPDRDLRSRSRAGRVQGLVQMVARGRRAARRGGARQGARQEPERPSLLFRLSGRRRGGRGDRRGSPSPPRGRRRCSATPRVAVHPDDERYRASGRRARCACRWSGG